MSRSSSHWLDCHVNFKKKSFVKTHHQVLVQGPRGILPRKNFTGILEKNLTEPLIKIQYNHYKGFETLQLKKIKNYKINNTNLGYFTRVILRIYKR